MPFNVYDKQKKYLGFIQSAYPQYTSVFMVASTEIELQEEDFNLNSIKSELAGFLGCKNLLGKINEPRLNKSIDNIIIKEFSKFKNNTYEELLKLVYLRMLRHGENLHYKNIENSQLSGYFWVDINNVIIENGDMIRDEEIDYINNEKIGKLIPLVAKVTDYPRIQINSMTSGQGLLLGADLADLAGRNHIHRTKLKIKSGNFSSELNFPVALYVKKDDIIQTYVDNRVINRVFCNGIIYEF